MRKFNWMTNACGVFLLWAMAAAALSAQTLTTLLSFDGTNGAQPEAALVQGTDGNFYGTTRTGGVNTNSECPDGCGTVFKISPGGALTTIYNFCSIDNCADGAVPYAALVEGSNGAFYGTTTAGGASTNLSCRQGGLNGCGTVFTITTIGTLTTLHSFDYTDGALPIAVLVQATNGDLYGTTYNGGANAHCPDPVPCGTIFKITPSGTFTSLHTFNEFVDGAFPYGGLVQATNGNFYGTTEHGGASTFCGSGCGTVFKMTPDGTLTTLYSFLGEGDSPGALPEGGLIQDADGNLYGTTSSGGAYIDYGTIFKITPDGTLTTLYSFDGADGDNTQAALLRADDGDLYGTTELGGNGAACFFGSEGCSTVFKMTPSGALTTLYNFCSQSICADGGSPNGLVQGTNGDLYGTTEFGGVNYSSCEIGCGAVFRLSVGLGPFVETEPTSGPIGGTVKIPGTDLTGATSVTFNGTTAVFTVVSASEITTTVPVGATTGKVQVTVPSGTLSSNVPFRVRP
jgi:uncharacterized repeat protein (TIGR03803 family)